MMWAPNEEDFIEFTRPWWYDPNLAFDTRAAVYTVTELPPDGDFDEDGDVDLADFGHMQICTGKAALRTENQNCLPGDFWADDAIDNQDMDGFVGGLTGP